MSGKKRGRPRKEKQFFSDPDANRKWNEERGKAKPLSPLAQTWKEGNERFKKEVRKEFGCGPKVPIRVPLKILANNDHPDPMELDELCRQLDQQRADQRNITKMAAEARNRDRAEMKHAVIENNRDLFDKVRAGGMTANSAATVILKNWKNRGGGGPILSARTLNAYLKEYRQA